MSVWGWFQGKGPSGFGYGATAEEVTEGLDLTGQRILVTGCNSGLGFEAMRVLALRGATVVGTARTLEKAAEACAKVKGQTEPVACELSDPARVRAAVETVKTGGPLSAILANAGIMALPKLELKFGLELQFLTNHVGHFLLVTGLLDHLTDTARVVVLSSSGHNLAPRVGIDFDNLDGSKSYLPYVAYGQSKLANLLFAKELARRFAGTKKTANAVHPGVIHTNLGRHMGMIADIAGPIASALVLKSVPEGAATEVFVATHPSLADVSGEYFADCNKAAHSARARDAALATRLWEETERIAARLQPVSAPETAG